MGAGAQKLQHLALRIRLDQLLHARQPALQGGQVRAPCRDLENHLMGLVGTNAIPIQGHLPGTGLVEGDFSALHQLLQLPDLRL